MCSTTALRCCGTLFRWLRGCATDHPAPVHCRNDDCPVWHCPLHIVEAVYASITPQSVSPFGTRESGVYARMQYVTDRHLSDMYFAGIGITVASLFSLHAVRRFPIWSTGLRSTEGSSPPSLRLTTLQPHVSALVQSMQLRLHNGRCLGFLAHGKRKYWFDNTYWRSQLRYQQVDWKSITHFVTIVPSHPAMSYFR